MVFTLQLTFLNHFVKVMIILKNFSVQVLSEPETVFRTVAEDHNITSQAQDKREHVH